MSCEHCGDTGFVPVCYNNDPDKCFDEPCECREAPEANPRERGDDDGVEYADPRDEMAERLERN